MFKKEKIKGLHYSVNGRLSADDLQKQADEVLAEYGKNAKIPGFRSGHIPLSILRQRYNKSAYGEAVDKLMNSDLEKYLADQKIRLAGSPKADVEKDWEIGKDVEYALEFDILPDLPEIDLEKITLMKKIAKVDEKEVDEALENIRKNRGVAEKQNEKYKAQKGDTVVIDFKGFIGNTPFQGGTAEKYNLVLGSDSFVPGFEEQILGHKTGDEFDVNVRFPDTYHVENLVGKNARFAVKIHEIRKQILPKEDDELAKAIGYETLEKLRDYIRSTLAEQYADFAQKEMRNKLLDILADKVKISLPEVLVEQELNMAKSEFDSKSQSDKNLKWDEKKERKDAERRVKLGLILAEWGTRNKVDVNRDELQQAIWAEAAHYPEPKQVFEFYNKNPNALSMLRGMLFERKTLDAMLTHTKIKEKVVKPSELFKSTSV